MFPVTTGSGITVEAGTETSRVSVGRVIETGVGVGVGTPAKATPLISHETARASIAPCQVVKLILVFFISDNLSNCRLWLNLQSNDADSTLRVPGLQLALSQLTVHGCAAASTIS